jgi:hypothetical protein
MGGWPPIAPQSHRLRTKPASTRTGFDHQNIQHQNTHQHRANQRKGKRQKQCDYCRAISLPQLQHSPPSRAASHGRGNRHRRFYPPHKYPQSPPATTELAQSVSGYVVSGSRSQRARCSFQSSKSMPQVPLSAGFLASSSLKSVTPLIKSPGQRSHSGI